MTYNNAFNLMRTPCLTWPISSTRQWSRATHLQRSRLLSTLPLLISLSACIAIPIQGGGEEPFQEEALAFVEIGKTTKEEIATAMLDFAVEKDGDEVRVKLTPQKFRDGNWWLYTQARKESKWFVMILDSGGIAGGGNDYRFLLIKFDDNGVVSEYQFLSSEGKGCNRDGVCSRNSMHSLLALEGEDRVVKQFDIPADRCGVYVYGQPKRYGATSIRLDGHRVGWILDKKQFFFWQIDQGVHQLAAPSPGISNRHAIEFTCAAGGLYFFELKPRIKRNDSLGPDYLGPNYWVQWVEIEQLDAINGRRAIGKRQLTLNTSEPSD